MVCVHQLYERAALEERGGLLSITAHHRSRRHPVPPTTSFPTSLQVRLEIQRTTDVDFTAVLQKAQVRPLLRPTLCLAYPSHLLRPLPTPGVA